MEGSDREETDHRSIGKDAVEYSTDADPLKRARDDLRYERDRAEKYLDLAGFIILGLDRTGKIEVLNKKGCELLGFAEPPTGRCWFDFIPKRFQPEIREAFRQLAQGSGLITDYENMIIAANGQERLISWHNTVLMDEMGNVIGMVSSGEDITEQRKADEELREAKDTLESLINFANAPIIVWGPDLKVTKFNHAFEHLTGYGASEVIGGPLEMLFPDDTREMSMTMIERTSTGEHWDSVEIPIRRKDGAQRTALWNSATLYVPGSARVLMTIAQGQDITERKKAEEELVESEARYRGLFENALGPVTLRRLVFDERGEIIDQILIDANPARLRLWDIGSIEDVRGKRYSEFLSPESADLALEQIRKMKALGKPITDEAHYDSDGTDYLMTFVPLGNDRVIATSVDITERKKSEKALKLSNEELRQFAYVASHDLQEPLRMVVSYMSLLERKFAGNLDPLALEYIQNAVSGGERMRELIDDLLEYSRLDTGHERIGLVDMNDVVMKALFMLKVPLEENQAETIVGPLPSAIADETQMIQVMQNLIGNSVKFHGEERPKISISATPGHGEWIFSVKDNGIGLNMEYADKIFHMFQRLHTRDQYEGTGVGLAVVRKIVERHGGRIWVESEEGKGAAFFFTIPKKPIN